MSGYVVCCCENLRDGREEWAKCFNTLDGAMAYINERSHGFAGSNCDFGLFELGRRIEIIKDKVLTPQPAVERTEYKIADAKPPGKGVRRRT